MSKSANQFASQLFEALWERYRSQVSYVADYERVIEQAGATFVNDHIAFRTFACQRPTTGIASIARIFEALGYRPAGCYSFPDKHLNAVHFQHANDHFPKLFVSELKIWELSDAAREIISRSVQTHRDPLPDTALAELTRADDLHGVQRAELMDKVVQQFHELPWGLPSKDDVVALNEESQYAAWVLVHGYHVNHFTSLINSHGVEQLDDIEKTAAALRAAGVPMKEQIEGEPGSKLRQTATEAVVIDVDVMEENSPARLPWTYAYFELAQRGTVLDPDSDKPVRFEGFLGPQATNLFEMTKVR